MPNDEFKKMAEETKPEINTINKQLVAGHGNRIVVMAPSLNMTPDDAILQAAWLVALAEPDATHKFADVLAAVQNT